MNRVCVIFCVLLLAVSIKPAPIDYRVVEYLYKYDYLTSAENVDDWVMQKGLKKFQSDVGLPLTGELDTATKAKMKLPRCGVFEQFKKTKATTAQKFSRPKWKKDQLTYKIWNWTKTFPKNNVTAMFERVSQLWTANLNLKIKKSSTNKADLNIYFAEYDGYGQTLGYAPDPPNGTIVLDQEDPLSLEWESGGCKFYAGWLLAHELGHALGLLHSDSTESIMHSTYNPEGPNAMKPSLIDKNNLVAIYGGKAALDKTMACQKTPIDAMFYMNRKHYLFKDKHYWTFNDKGLQEGPFLVTEMFPLDSIIVAMMANNITNKTEIKFDAAFSNGEITYLFKNKVFFSFKPRNFTGRKIIKTTYENLTPNLDAVLYEPTKNIVHFFKGSKYYKFDKNKENGTRLDNETSISQIWNGIPDDIEAATLMNTKTGLIVKNSTCHFINMDTKKLIKEQDCNQFFNC